MRKKTASKYGSPTKLTPPATLVTNSAVHKSPQDNQLFIWSESLEYASEVYKSFDMMLDIDIDQEWLSTILDRLQPEDTSALAKWIERFAEISRELGRLKVKLHEEYSARWDAANQLGLASEEKDKDVAAQLTQLEIARQAFESRSVELEREEAKLAGKKSELLQIERSLRLRETNAEAGFVEQNEQALKQLEEYQRQRTEQFELTFGQLLDDKQKLSDDIRQATRDLAELKHQYTAAEIDRTRQLDQREHEIKQNNMVLDRDRSRLDREWNDIKEAENSLEQRIDSEMESERANHAKELARMEIQRDKAWQKVEELKNLLADIQELKHTLGEHSVSEVLEQLESLREQNRILRRNLDQSDTAELLRENEYLRNSKVDLERDISTLRPELDNARRELSIKRVSATELEAVAREKRVLEQHKNTLAVHIDDLESRIEQLTNAQKKQTPFPAMSLMDSDKEFRASIELEDVPDLKFFAEELQHRIAKAEKNVELFYPIEDIRVLLGGLAMSQLHVFQGISGTGKTSLAKAFAKAIGGSCTDIAVQAGWRDRDDLLGHYNAFERRFYEKDCLQAIYKAQTPRWQDACNIILLDEMNLSRPEQYFAEFLSALEKNNGAERLISLSETALPNAPIMLRDGRKILVPENIWFIGTANHDETTNELADKTYDRAHVMTLPKQDHRFKTKKLEPTSYSYRSLRNAFKCAQVERKEEIRELLGRLTRDDFTKHLGNHFALGWGNRFEKQALDFIPVMLATGAKTGEALDHLLSTRVMRSGKVTGRYNIGVDIVKQLKDILENFWINSNLDGDPCKSLDLLDADIRRLEGLN
ncbi:TPA: AAA family ATPase [Aeromonas salmonicida]|uniref:AAA family ATPase n=1 Tax=Aeromonas salmonicida TaxID=645 RepID=UPI0033081740|nr:AAA family ATPase [Aeromonas salmonicida]